MAKLIYSMIGSIDGIVEDDAGQFDWAVPDTDVHAFINDLQRRVGTYLYGRRMYETMHGWETEPDLARQSPEMQDFAQLWQAAEEIVYSTTLAEPLIRNTRIERAFTLPAPRTASAAARQALRAWSSASSTASSLVPRVLWRRSSQDAWSRQLRPALGRPA